jgi:nucleotide-binding universal stress UspA family protein
MSNSSRNRVSGHSTGMPSDWPGSPLSTLHYRTTRPYDTARRYPSSPLPSARAETQGRSDAGDVADTMTIVVGVSGSPASALALRWAAGEAHRLGARLHVVLIWTIEPRAHYAPAISTDEGNQRHERAVAGLAATVKATTGFMASAAVTTTVAPGVPERELVEQSAGADLLVLGSAAGLTAGSIGPVIRACLSHAHCPVVVVGPEGPRSHGRPVAAQPAAAASQGELLLAGPTAPIGGSAVDRRS